MPSACLLALTTIIAAFQRMKARMRRSMCSSPGNHGSCSRRDRVDVRACETVAGKLTWRLLGPLEQLGQQEAGAGLAVGVDDGVERVEPLLRLARDRCRGAGGRSRRRSWRPVSHRVDRGRAPVDRGTVPSTCPCRDRRRSSCTPTAPAPGTPGPAGGRGPSRPTGAPSGPAASARTTNQRMEITAVLEALRALAPAGPVEVVSDSTYVVNCFRDRWWVRWEANGWRNAKKQAGGQRRPVGAADRARRRPATSRSAGSRATAATALNDLVDRLAVAAIPR